MPFPVIPPQTIPYLRSTPPDLPPVLGTLDIEFTSLSADRQAYGHNFSVRDHSRGFTREEFEELVNHVDAVARGYRYR